MPPSSDCSAQHAYILDGRCRLCRKTIVQGQPADDRKPTSPTRWDVNALCAAVDDPAFEEYLIFAVTRDSVVPDVLPFFEKLLQADADRFLMDAPSEICGRGRKLSAEEVSLCESTLTNDASSLATRLLLLGHYRWAAHQPGGSKEYSELVYWLIENVPTCSICSKPDSMIVPQGEDYEKGKQLWQQQVDKDPANTTILSHAAYFHLIYDRRKSEELLESARALEPERRTWMKRLAELHALDVKCSSGAEKKAAAVKALAFGEMALRFKDDPFETKVRELAKRAEDEMSPELVEKNIDELRRFYELSALATLAVEADELQWARNYAYEFLELDKIAFDHRSGRMHLQAVRTVLGRLALRNGDITQAKQYLAESLEAEMSAFGPDLSLAAELLAHGEREAVRDFLIACRTKWRFGTKYINEWIAELDAGGTPALASFG